MKNQHEKQYESERSIRWTMASENEKKEMQRILNVLVPAYPKIKPIRYDKAWFNLLPTEKLDCWVRGVSDYAVKLDDNKGFFAEIKIKTRFFRKTKTGGVTQSGNPISNYGCESVYLDIFPVFGNVMKFLEIFDIPETSFIFFFSHIGHQDIYAISMAEINYLLKFGYRGQKITEYGEGYGIKTTEGRARCYLLPVEAMHILGERDRLYFELHCTDKIVYPTNYLEAEDDKRNVSN